MAASDSRRSVFSGMSTLPTFTNNVSSSNPQRRMLKKDPNGTVVWRGAGRSRSSSAQPRQSARANAKATTQQDTSKRRKITEESTPELEPVAPITPSVSSASGPPFNIGSAPKREFVKKPILVYARQRTAPVVSSPLRNVITGSPPGSPPTSVNSAASSTSSQTRAASALTAIVEKATPPPKPDIANPYEVAAPIKPVAKPKERKRLGERKKAQEEAAKAKQTQPAAPASKEKEMSAKSIIEATVPKVRHYHIVSSCLFLIAYPGSQKEQTSTWLRKAFSSESHKAQRRVGIRTFFKEVTYGHCRRRRRG